MDNTLELERKILERMEREQIFDVGETLVVQIDNDLRTINIPSDLKLLGVESDEDVNRIYFKMPRTYGEFDLSEFDIRVNYINGTDVKNGDSYIVEDKRIENDNILFSWLVGRNAVKRTGDTQFIVCLKKLNLQGVTLKEFNTTVAKLPVLKGLETTEAIEEQNKDIIEQILKEMDEIRQVGENVEQYAGAAKKSAEDAKEYAEDAIAAATESGNTTKEVKGSYITADSTFQGSAIIKEIPGATVQNQEPPPSPDNPQEIRGARCNIKTTGENLIDYYALKKDYWNGSEFEFDSAKNLIFEKNMRDYIGKTVTISADIFNTINQSGNNTKAHVYAKINGKNVYGNIANEVEEYEKSKLTVTILTENDYVGMIYASNGKVKVKNVCVVVGESSEYVEYKGCEVNVPLEYPLYEGDRIYLEDGELWEYRENGRVVINGTNDIVWLINDDITGIRSFHFKLTDGKIGFQTSVASNYQNENYAWALAKYGVYSDHSIYANRFFTPPNAEVKTLEQWKTWLQSNPFELVYKLATPTLKKLGSAEAFNLHTFDGITYIEVMGSKELGTENTFIVPQNQSGGIMTDAFATAKRNEINMAEQANIVSRISALEKLAVKER